MEAGIPVAQLASFVFSYFSIKVKPAAMPTDLKQVSQAFMKVKTPGENKDATRK